MTSCVSDPGSKRAPACGAVYAAKVTARNATGIAARNLLTIETSKASETPANGGRMPWAGSFNGNFYDQNDKRARILRALCFCWEPRIKPAGQADGFIQGFVQARHKILTAAGRARRPRPGCHPNRPTRFGVMLRAALPRNRPPLRSSSLIWAQISARIFADPPFQSGQLAKAYGRGLTPPPAAKVMFLITVAGGGSACPSATKVLPPALQRGARLHLHMPSLAAENYRQGDS